MKRKSMVLIAILLVSLVAAMPVLADAPMEGTVYEGNSVPGIALGFSRAEVEAAYGQPYYCQVHAFPDDFAFCTFPVSGGGLVSIRYRGADGGFAHNSPDDEVVYAGWGEPVGGWTTAAGVNTTLAKADPDAVIAAYPDAEVSGNPGVNGSVIDWLRGIEVRWTYDGYTGHTHVYMNIFEPLASLPDAQETHVETIELSGYKDGRLRKIRGWAEILNEYERAALGATVYATWILPDGSTQPVVEEFVGISGVAFFELFAPSGRAYRGTFRLRIDNVQLGEYTFDPAGSVLESSIYIK